MKLIVSVKTLNDMPTETVLSLPFRELPLLPITKGIGQKVIESIELPLGWMPKLCEYRDIVGDHGFAVFRPADRESGALAAGEPGVALDPSEICKPLKDAFDGFVISWEVSHD